MKIKTNKKLNKTSVYSLRFFVCCILFMIALGGTLYAEATPGLAPLTTMEGESSNVYDDLSYYEVSGLALTVQEAGSATFTMPGMMFHAQDGIISPYPFTFGETTVGSGSYLISQQDTEVTNTMRFGINQTPGNYIDVTMTRLSPAVLLESSANTLWFFGPEEDPISKRDEDARLRSTWYTPDSGEYIAAGTTKPLRWATPSGASISTGALGTQTGLPDLTVDIDRVSSSSPTPSSPSTGDLDETWLLLWYGAESPFVASQVPFVDTPSYNAITSPVPTWEWMWPYNSSASSYHADVPILLVFENAPTAVQYESDGVKFTFSSGAGKIAMMPLYGHAPLRADDTEGWLSSFPSEVADRCDMWAQHLAKIPTDVNETVAYNSGADEVTMTETFTYTTVRSAGQDYAPVPPMLALAWQHGMPIVFSDEPNDTEVVPTVFGPVCLIEDDSYTWTVDDLGKYALEYRQVGDPNGDANDLELELQAEVDKIIDTGHLAPLLIAFRYGDGGWLRGTSCWRDPADILMYLASVIDILPTAQQSDVRTYMSSERSTYQPESLQILEMSTGTQREWWNGPNARYEGWATVDKYMLMGTYQFLPACHEFLDVDPSIYRAYGLADYYRTLGSTPSSSVLTFCDDAFDYSVEDTTWDTLGWVRGKYAFKQQWVVTKTQAYTLRGVHRDLAGIVGYIRMCDQASASVPNKVWGQYARLAALRFALGNYGRYLATNGIKGEHQYADASSAVLPDANLADPNYHVYYQVLELQQHGVTLCDGASTRKPSVGAYHLTFLDMVPETARLLADWGMADDVTAYIERFAARQPNWYAAYADAIDGEEIALMYPSDSQQLFMANAWFAQTAPATLERWIDYPWAELGDLYFIQKLGETIRAYRGFTWTTGGGDPNDTTAPTPDPLTWSTVPYTTGSTSISMTATTASDPSGVEYYFDCTAGGGNDSGWQDSTSYQDTGLDPNTQYTYRVQARDKSANQNAAGWSSSQSATTSSGGGDPNGLIGHWALDDGSGTTATDSSINGYDGTLTDGPTWTTGKISGGLDFDGSNDYVNIPNVSYTANGITLAAWVKHESTPSHAERYIEVGYTKAMIRREGWGTGVLGFFLDIDGGLKVIQVQNVLSVGTWHHVAGTWDGTTMRLYLDGTELSNSTPGDDLYTGTYDTHLGASGTETMNGIIDDARIYNRALSETEIETIMSGSTPPDTTAPTPNPLTWSTVPYATGSTSISMTATTASDASGVEYYFDCTAGAGGHDSGWQDSSTYQDTGLSPSTQYTYRVQARDKSANQNVGSWSTSESATTDAQADTTPPTPNPLTWSTVPYATGSTSVSMTATTASDPSGVEYYFDCTAGAGGHDSGWQDGTTYQDTGLSPSTQYSYRVQARDKSVNQNATAWSSTQSATTGSGGGDPNGLIGHWALDDGSGTTATDSSVNGYDGTLTNGPVWTIGKIDGGLDFDASDDYVSIPSVSFTNNGITLAAWVYHDTFAAHTERYIEINGGSRGMIRREGWGTGVLSVFFYIDGSLKSINVQNVLSEDTWHHVAGTWDGTTMRLYLDGDSINSSQLGDDLFTGTYNVNLGSTGSETMGGIIDDARIYDRALSETEIETIMSGSTPPYTTAPTPNPLTWSTVPYATGSTSISMTATTASDPSGVEYYFDCTAGAGGHDSGWQDSSTYQDTGLSPSTQYTYRVQARDKSANQNTGGWSTSQSATTDAQSDTTPPTPDPMTWATAPYATGSTSVSMTATTASDPSGVEYYFDCTAGAGGHDSGWQDSTAYQDTGLSPSTQYSYRVQARDKSANQNATAWSSTESATTDANEPEGLMGHWALDDGSGTTAADSSGNGYNGTLTNGPVWTTGKINGGLDFDASNDYVSIPSVSYTENAITVAAWVYHDSFAAHTERYVEVTGGRVILRREGWGTGVLTIYFNIGGSLKNVTVQNVLSEDTWHHVAGIWNGTTLRLYLDGDSIGSSTPSGSLFTGTYNTYLGSIGSETTGSIVDDVRIYDRALSETEIETIMGD